jgi:NitT/TauT family transport system permease protein
MKMSGPMEMWLGTLGMIVFMGAWEILGFTGILGGAFPALTAVVETVIDPVWRDLFLSAFGSTAWSALQGFLLGISLAMLLASATVLIPPLREGIYRFTATMQSIPVISLGPVFIVTLGREITPIAVASIGAAFAMFVGTTSGLSAARVPHHDLLSVLGATRMQRFIRLQLPAALPNIADGMKLAAPASLIGAIIGEWFGAPSGLGLIIVSALLNYQINLLWGAALLATLLSLAAFGALTIFQRSIERRFQ